MAFLQSRLQGQCSVRTGCSSHLSTVDRVMRMRRSIFSVSARRYTVSAPCKKHPYLDCFCKVGAPCREEARAINVVVAAAPPGTPSQPGNTPPRAGKKKAKKLVDINGDVNKDLGNGMFNIKLENGVTVMAHLSGKIRQNRIKILMGDKVTVELSPYDLTKGRITYRFKPGEYDRLQQAAAALAAGIPAASSA